MRQQTADKIKRKLYELARNEFIPSSMLYQEMDTFINSLVSEDETNEIELKRYIEYFGEDKQMVVAIEEMAELTQQLSKIVIGHRRKSRERVVEEWIDVHIMLNQMRIIFQITEKEIAEGRKDKLKILSDWLDKESER